MDIFSIIERKHSTKRAVIQKQYIDWDQVNKKFTDTELRSICENDACTRDMIEKLLEEDGDINIPITEKAIIYIRKHYGTYEYEKNITKQDALHMCTIAGFDFEKNESKEILLSRCRVGYRGMLDIYRDQLHLIKNNTCHDRNNMPCISTQFINDFIEHSSILDKLPGFSIEERMRFSSDREHESIILKLMNKHILLNEFETRLQRVIINKMQSNLTVLSNRFAVSEEDGTSKKYIKTGLRYMVNGLSYVINGIDTMMSNVILTLAITLLVKELTQQICITLHDRFETDIIYSTTPKLSEITKKFFDFTEVNDIYILMIGHKSLQFIIGTERLDMILGALGKLSAGTYITSIIQPFLDAVKSIPVVGSFFVSYVGGTIMKVIKGVCIIYMEEGLNFFYVNQSILSIKNMYSAAVKPCFMRKIKFVDDIQNEKLLSRLRYEKPFVYIIMKSKNFSRYSEMSIVYRGTDSDEDKFENFNISDLDPEDMEAYHTLLKELPDNIQQREKSRVLTRIEVKKIRQDENNGIFDSDREPTDATPICHTLGTRVKCPTTRL